MNSVMKMGETQVVAQIKRVHSEIGNRIYELNFVNGSPMDGHGHFVLDLEGHDSERDMFYKTNSGISNLYYVWQLRAPRQPVACPRCKYRLNAPMFKTGE